MKSFVEKRKDVIHGRKTKELHGSLGLVFSGRSGLDNMLILYEIYSVAGLYFWWFHKDSAWHCMGSARKPLKTNINVHFNNSDLDLQLCTFSFAKISRPCRLFLWKPAGPRPKFVAQTWGWALVAKAANTEQWKKYMYLEFLSPESIWALQNSEGPIWAI